MTHWQARQINYTNSLPKDFEAAVLQHESIAPVYSRLIALSSSVNPGLNIGGQGAIEFPVPIQDLVPSVPSPINRSQPEDGSQWEMESKYVRFDNPNWEQFLRNSVNNHDTKASSVQEHAVEFEFRKLVIFDSGSSNFPQSCYADGDDNSGILLVFLPSKSPSTEAAVTGIDYGEYRLALYYNLTFPSNVNFTNTLYVEDNLRRVLVKWNKGKYPCKDEDYFDSSAPYLFFRLSRNYDLDNAELVLAYEDGKMASFIHRVAEELDFILCLGHYCRSIDPTVHNNGFISHVIDMDGDHVIGSQSLWPPLNNCIGESAEGVGDKPVGEEVLDDPPSCTVMVLFRAKAMYDIAFSQSTIQEMSLGLVSISDRPAKKVKRMAMYVINLLKGDWFSSGLNVLASIIELALSRLDIELWNEAVKVSLAHYDLVLHNQNVLLQSLQVFGFEKVRSSFELILNTALFRNLYTFLREIPSNLAMDGDADAINLWCDDRLRLSLRRLDVNKHVNVPLLFDVAHSHGIHYLLEIRRTKHRDVALLFVDELIKTLQRKKSDILASKSNVPFNTVRATAILEGQGCNSSVLSSEDAIDFLVNRWLSEAIKDLLIGFGENRDYFDHYSDMNGEYFDFTWWRKTHEHLIVGSSKCIELCIIVGHVERCGTILDAIEGLDGNERTKLQFCIIPLAYRLGPLLQAMHADISSPPFAPFFQRVIERYVRYFLGTRTHNPQERFLRQKIDRRFHCACKTCTEVKEFLHQLYIPQRYLPGSEAVLWHIECNTVILHELVDIKLVDRPRIALQITKKQKIFAMQRWENRVKNLQTLLHCIGSDHIIERVMGDRYSDLKLAMEGKGEMRNKRKEYKTRGGKAERRRRTDRRDGNRKKRERKKREEQKRTKRRREGQSEPTLWPPHQRS